jgi:hypothetical protein
MLAFLELLTFIPHTDQPPHSQAPLQTHYHTHEPPHAHAFTTTMTHAYMHMPTRINYRRALCSSATVPTTPAHAKPLPLWGQSLPLPHTSDWRLVHLTTLSCHNFNETYLAWCRPVKTYEMVVRPEEPWEEQIFAYNSMVQVSNTEVRIYYDNFGKFGRYICVAVSHDSGVSDMLGC